MAVFVPVTFAMAAHALAGGAEGAAPLQDGDWLLQGTNVYMGEDLYVQGNITVSYGASLTLDNTTLVVEHKRPNQFTFTLQAGASLFLRNSHLWLDSFVADEQSALDIEGSSVNTTGRFLAMSISLFAEDSQFGNIAPDGGEGEPGGDAVFVANGVINSELVSVTVYNRGGDAGEAGPASPGLEGGDSVIVSNVSRWMGCQVRSIGGRGSTGGRGTASLEGGDGGEGGNATITLSPEHLDGCVLLALGGEGMHGGHGAEEGPEATDGGAGGEGGNATVKLRTEPDIQVLDCLVEARSGEGGSGGNGGEATNGTTSDAGRGGPAGRAVLTIEVPGDLEVRDSELSAHAGKGGHGGDYQSRGSTSEWGHPKDGGPGGDAELELYAGASVELRRTRVEARGGAGLDGGGGYDQGAIGGPGGNASVRVRTVETVLGDHIELLSRGGDGGDGGPAFSEIDGDGGDGGDAYLQVEAGVEVRVDHITIDCQPGEGGRGDSASWDGVDGFSTLDVDTMLLLIREGSIDQPLDDLHGSAQGHLFNVSWPRSVGIPVLPMESAEAWTYYPLTVVLVDQVDPVRAKPLVGWKVIVRSVETDEVVAEGVTDDEGRCHFNLTSFHYTSTKAEYMGAYYILAISPDGLVTKTVRHEHTAPTELFIPVVWAPLRSETVVASPEEGKQYNLSEVKGDRIEVFGSATIYNADNAEVFSVSLRIHPAAQPATGWPMLELMESPVPRSGVNDTEDRWGWFFPPEVHDILWWFYGRFDVFDENLDHVSGPYVLRVVVVDSLGTHETLVDFDLDIERIPPEPWVIVDTPLEGRVFNGSSIVILGEAGDDEALALVEVRVDDGEWEPVTGTTRWSYDLDTRGLPEGGHMISFRAFDGEHHSAIRTYEFTVDLPDGGGGGGGGGDGGDAGASEPLVWGLIALLVAVLLISLAYVSRRIGSEEEEAITEVARTPSEEANLK